MENHLFPILFASILVLSVIIAVYLPRFLDYICEKNQIKFVKLGYKLFLKTYPRNRKLEDETEVVLVKLAEKSPLHMETLLLYRFPLCKQAAEEFVKIFLNSEGYSLFVNYLDKSIAPDSVMDVLIRDQSTMSQHLLSDYAYKLSTDQLIQLADDKNLDYIFKEACKRKHHLSNQVLSILIDKAAKDRFFKEVLASYIDGLKRCSPKSFDKFNEMKLASYGELSDLLIEYVKISKELSTDAQKLLANTGRFVDGTHILHYLLKTVQLSNPLFEFIFKHDLGMLNTYIKENELTTEQQILLVKAYKADSRYHECLETQILFYDLCEKAKTILMM